MKIIKNKYDKKAINELPKEAFPGRIYVVLNEEEADKAVAYLLEQPILGFDTETKPSFAKGHGMHKVALLQVASHDVCFLFRLNRIGITDSIVRLLSDKKVLKVALSWHDDIRQLKRRRQFATGSFVEIQDYVKQFGIEDLSLQKLYANLFLKKISKSQRLTNWEADHLSEGQQVYAATDAWACIRLYEELRRMEITQDYVVDRVGLELDDDE